MYKSMCIIMCTHLYIYIYIYYIDICLSLSLYIYIYREREREIDGWSAASERAGWRRSARARGMRRRSSIFVALFAACLDITILSSVFNDCRGNPVQAVILLSTRPQQVHGIALQHVWHLWQVGTSVSLSLSLYTYRYRYIIHIYRYIHIHVYICIYIYIYIYIHIYT